MRALVRPLQPSGKFPCRIEEEKVSFAFPDAISELLTTAVRTDIVWAVVWRLPSSNAVADSKG